MSFLPTVMERIKPTIKNEPESKDDSVQGSLDPDVLSSLWFGKILKDVTKNMKRADFLDSIDEMINDGALADKALDKLCADATTNPVQIDGPSRRKKAIKDFLKRIQWRERSGNWLYSLLAYGDLYLQKVYEKSSDPRKIGNIESVVKMPVDTIVRNVNERDEFFSLNEAFFQVPDLKYQQESNKRIPFHLAKIQHVRNDIDKTIFFPYGRSTWCSAVRIFNIAMMLLEDSAIGRHQSTQNLFVHYVGRHSDVRVTEPVLKEYAERAKAKLTDNTTHYMTDGKNQIDLMGGTKASIGGVDDIRLMLSILAVAIDYPIDLLSAGVADDAGGEELFRKEVVLARTVNNLNEKMNNLILRPLIDTELHMINAYGPYDIVTQPVTFEDKTKKSNRQMSEVERGLLSPESYWEGNHTERSWAEEQVRIEKNAEFVQRLSEAYPAYTITLIKPKNVTTGESGNPKPVEEQQQRVTPGRKGTDE